MYQTIRREKKDNIGIAVENELFAMCFATGDQKEGMGAFLEKRKEKHFQNK